MNHFQITFCLGECNEDKLINRQKTGTKPAQSRKQQISSLVLTQLQ